MFICMYVCMFARMYVSVYVCVGSPTSWPSPLLTAEGRNLRRTKQPTAGCDNFMRNTPCGGTRTRGNTRREQEEDDHEEEEVGGDDDDDDDDDGAESSSRVDATAS